MSFASDKLYNGYLRRNMPAIVTKVKVREIVIHLPCLTAHDRENIEAKRETCGNFDGMMLLLDCLKRRENWPEQFIEALEACEQMTIAAQIRAEYDALKATNNSNPTSPPTTVVRAHVHPAPSASHLSVPESGANSQAAVAPPAEAPPEPAIQGPPPSETPTEPQAPQSITDQVPKAVSPPEPVPEPVPEPAQSAQMEVPAPPSTPPPSPEIPHSEAAIAPLPQGEINSHQEPEENSESDVQDVSGDTGVIHDQVSSADSEVSIDSETNPHPDQSVEQCEADTASCPDPLHTAIATEDRPAESPPPAQIMTSDLTNGSSFLTITPEKPPVQDTTPQVDIVPAAVLPPEEMSDPPAAQVAESSQTETAATTSPEPGDAGMDTSPNDEESVCLSKPCQLVSIQTQNHASPTVPAPSSLVEPYSGNSERLEISESAPDAVTPDQAPACSAVSSTIEATVIAPPCQENGIAPNHNEPEENHYESSCESLGMQEVLVNVVQVSGEPSIPDLDGQIAAPQIVNGEVAKEATSAPPSSTNAVADDTIPSLNTPSSESCRPSEPAPADISTELKTLQDSEQTTAPQTPLTRPTNTKYILTAAGVGAFALLMAWKYKN